jgi:hypothetical protein
VRVGRSLLFFLNDYLASNSISRLSYSLFYLSRESLLRTAVNSICLGTCLLFLICAFILKAGAKVTILFYLASVFENIFNLIFSALVFSNLKIVFPSAGCKDNNTFHFYKSF